MKTLIASMLFAAAVFSLADTPPVSKLTKEQAVAIADKRLSNDDRFKLLDVQWPLVSTFKPTQNGGLDFCPRSHFPGEYAWFATYSITRDPTEPKRIFEARILLLQIGDDGVAEGVAGMK